MHPKPKKGRRSIERVRRREEKVVVEDVSLMVSNSSMQRRNSRSARLMLSTLLKQLILNWTWLRLLKRERRRAGSIARRVARVAFLMSMKREA
jgi:hypothetical protein